MLRAKRIVLNIFYHIYWGSPWSKKKFLHQNAQKSLYIGSVLTLSKTNLFKPKQENSLSKWLFFNFSLIIYLFGVLNVVTNKKTWLLSGAIIGDGDRKSWDARGLVIWDNFSIFRTNRAILTSYIHAAPRTCRGFPRGCCHVAWSKMMRVRSFHSDGRE